jgi:hypothetical protein
MHLRIIIESTKRYTPRLCSRKFGDALGGYDGANVRIQTVA